MSDTKIQKKLGLCFAGINIVSIILAIVTSYIFNIKWGLAAFLSSVLILTLLIQSYGQRKLEKEESVEE